ncbi:type II toxin-antitoxin system death-on-curing family toxin [Pseudoxanthomonas sacheonensis]|uniref:type II toxin-antitoxin system death-on-curing family toxin n=1 Tax=Pseudoxanthomonas sacheonensis TaxID=443615 RepID=UPI001BAC94EF|nr:Fic family protein [Pseudoxanthomonas sacheonensis]
MEFVNPALEKDYERWRTRLEGSDFYGKDSLTAIQVLRAHYAIADYFVGPDKGIGGIGPRDENLLLSAVFRQSAAFGGYEKWPKGVEKVATLVYGLIKDHPFHDANKRTALLSMLYHLQRLDRTPTIAQKQLEDLVVAVADDGLGEFRRYVDLRKDGPDPEVRFLADYFSRNSRKIDRRQQVITHQDLARILKSFGYEMCDAEKSFIDIVKVEIKRPLFAFGKTVESRKRVKQIHFPGWKRQVPPDTVKAVREDLNLTWKKGVDSETFYGKADSMNALINEYAGPLQRLADR